MNDETKQGKDCTGEDFNEIRYEYLETVHVPGDRPVRQFLLCPVGLLGAGKTTVLKPLAERLNLVRVSTDEIRKMLKERGFNYDAVKQMALSIVVDFVNKGYSVALDANCGSPETREKIKELEEKYGVKPVWVHIDPPEDFIVDKLRNFKHTWLFKSGEDAVTSYYKYKEKYSDLMRIGIDYVYTFDTSKPDLPDQLDEAARGIEAVLKGEK